MRRKSQQTNTKQNSQSPVHKSKTTPKSSSTVLIPPVTQAPSSSERCLAPNMTDICRLCASLKRLDHLQTLSNPILDAATKLARCCQLQFPPASDELLPQMVCLDCVGHLNSSFAFAERVHQAQETLRQAFLVDMQLNCNSGQTPLQQMDDDAEVQSPHREADRDTEAAEQQQQLEARTVAVEPQFKIRSVIHSLHLKGYSVPEICERLKLADTKMVSDWIFTYQTLTQCSATVEAGQDGEDGELHEVEQEQQEQEVFADKREQLTDGAIEIIVVEDELPHCEGDQLDTEDELAETVEDYGMETSDLSLKSDIEIVDELNGFADSNESHAPHVFLPTGFEDPDISQATQLVPLTPASSFELVLQALHPAERLPDGRISDDGCLRIGIPLWHQYPWNCGRCATMHIDDAASLGSAAAVRRHSRRQHPTDRVQFACADCPRSFSKSRQLVEHVRDQHESLLRLSCDLCSAPFWSERALRQHRETHLPQLVAVYVEEEEEAGGDEALETGTVAAAENGDKRLGEPSQGKSGSSSRSSSIDRGQFDDDQQCVEAAAADEDAANVVVRMELVSVQQNQRQQHSPNAVGRRQFVCDQCGIGFAVKRKLNAHLIEAHRRVEGREVPLGEAVDAARMPVTAEKIYHCDECSKTFKTQVRLHKHRTVHTGQKPYKCDQCGREFRERGTLREHARIHTGAMPFVCEFCNKRFRFKGVLTTHRRQHTGERPYSCVECNHHFTNWPNYNKHMKRKHGINTSVNVRKPQAIPPSGMPAKAKLNHVVPTADNVNPPATPTPGSSARLRSSSTPEEMNESIELQLQPDASSASASVCIEYLATSGGDANDLTTDNHHHHHHHRRLSGDVSVMSSATTAACGDIQQQQQQHIAGRPVLFVNGASFGSYGSYVDHSLQPATTTTAPARPMSANGFGSSSSVDVMLLADQKLDAQQY